MRRRNPQTDFGVSGMESPPANELGVVCLFALMHSRLGFRRIKRIQRWFPDCVAVRRDGSRETEVSIEFEYKSSDFRKHRHSLRGCDYIVCWEHDWIPAPMSLHRKILELRKFLRMGRDVWVQPVAKRNWGWFNQATERSGRWPSPPPTVKKGDLVVWYLSSPRKHIDRVSLVTGDPRPDKEARRGYSVQMKRLVRLAHPISFQELRTSRDLQGAPFMGGNLRRQSRATAWWTSLYQLILAKNPSASRKLKGHTPEML